MIKDTKISEIFQIPSKMLQRWKNASDYRYLIYTYLHNSDADEVEAFFRYLTTKKSSNYSNTDNEKLALKFLYKKDFITLVKKHIGQYLKESNIKVYTEETYDSVFTDKKSLKVAEASLIIKKANEQIIYVEISSRVLEAKPLRERLHSLKGHLRDGLTLKGMLFITNEKQLPVYLRKDNIVENVWIENINIDEFSKIYLGIKKVIFVPSTMKIPATF